MYLDLFTGNLSLGVLKRWWLHRHNIVGLLREGKQLLDLGQTGRLGSRELSLELLNASHVLFGPVFPTACQTDVEVDGEGLEEGAEHVQTVGEEFAVSGGTRDK